MLNIYDNLDKNLSIRIKKKKIYIVEGYINYPLVITNKSTNCICSKEIDNNLCKFCKIFGLRWQFDETINYNYN